jgi:hypothetical protein
MMNRLGLIIAAAFAATLAGGCAAPNGTQKEADDEDKVYVTGSRIPVKESPHSGVKAMTDRKAINDMMRGGGASGGVVGAGGS